MKRIILMVLRNILFVPYLWIKLNWYASHVDRYSEEERYALLKKIDHAANTGGNIKIEAHGTENIPEENGFIFYPNHQGLYDVLAIIEACPKPFSVVAKKELAEVKGKIKGLRNFIKDYSLLSQSEFEQISIWEDYFIMAVALHVNKKATNYLYDLCNSMTENVNFANSLSACGTYAVFSNTMRTPFTRYVSSYVYSQSSGLGSGSSFSGSSGGFSGGSHSGGGGRRWRSEEALSKER